MPIEPMPEAIATLRQQALALCRQAHEAPADRQLAARIDAWRQRSPSHEACWQQTWQQWSLAGDVERHPPAHLFERLWYACDLGWERLRENLAAQPAMVAVPLLLLLVTAVMLPGLRQQPESAPVQSPLAQQAPAVKTSTYSSPWGEQRQHTLADGSLITLNWNSVATVTLESNSRRVVLQRGEALFSVTPDRNRPFIVSAGAVETRAVGTAFSVQRNGDTAHIIVTEGTVEIAVPQLQSILANANEAVSADATHIGAIATVDAATATAWTEGMLVFRERPLLDVLQELGRYTNFKVIAGSVRNADSPVTATYFTDRADDALRLVAQAFDLQLVSNTDGSVRVDSLPPQRMP